MKLTKFWLVLGTFLTICGTFLPLSAQEQKETQEVFLGEEDWLSGIRKSYDRNADGKADKWLHYSYRGDMTAEDYDNNYDDWPDQFVEYVRIKNFVRRSFDTHFDGKDDRVIFEFPDRNYEFNDNDQDGFFDKFAISNKENTVLTSKDIHTQWDSSLSFLIEFFTQNSYTKETKYIARITSSKYIELQLLLDEAQKDPTNKEKWQGLLDKTREYLDLPSQTILPIEIELWKEKQPGADAGLVPLNILGFCPSTMVDLTTWLGLIDHEMVHAIQQWRFFKKHNKTTMTWPVFIQVTKQLSEGKEPPELENDEKLKAFRILVVAFDNYNKSSPVHEVETYYTNLGGSIEYYSPTMNEDEITEAFMFSFTMLRAHMEVVAEYNLPVPDIYVKSMEETAKVIKKLEEGYRKDLPPEEFEMFDEYIKEEIQAVKEWLIIKYDLKK